MSARARSVAAAVGAALALVAGAGPAAAATPGAADRLLGTTRYLANVTPTGAFTPPAVTIVENPSTQAWGALGLAAAGINVARQRNTGATIYTALRNAFAPQLRDTSDRALYLLVEATVRDLRHDDGTDDDAVLALVDGVLAAQVSVPGPESGGFVDQGQRTAGDARATALAALGLEAVREVRDVRVSAGAAADAAVAWLLGHQQPDGSWWIGGATPGPDTETSTLAIEAIVAAGLPASRTHAALSAFGTWLQGRQNADGGFGRGAVGGPSDLLATAAAARALAATGVAPSAYAAAASGATPVAFLGAAQDPQRHDLGTTDPVRVTGYAAFAFAGQALPLGYVTGTYGVSSSAPQTPPKGLPTGPTLPIELPSPTAPPTPPTTSATAAPVLRPAAGAPQPTPSAGVRRIENHHKPRPSTAVGGDGGTGLAGDGNGPGGGGGTLATAVAPDRAGGGGGTGTSLTSVPAAVAGAPLPTDAPRRRGGTPVKTADDADRRVRGTLIGRDSATPGATGSRTGAPGASGSAAGHGTTPWWAIALALLVGGGIVAGATLDRRRPELAL